MRMWMLPPSILCRQHLLGEHKELHMLVGSINKGISLQGYLDKHLIEPQNIKKRHEALVKEMIKRGYNHKSPLSEFHTDLICKVDHEKSRYDISHRCSYCSL